MQLFKMFSFSVGGKSQAFQTSHVLLSYNGINVKVATVTIVSFPLLMGSIHNW